MIEQQQIALEAKTLTLITQYYNKEFSQITTQWRKTDGYRD
jgi:hypothetical protein